MKSSSRNVPVFAALIGHVAWADTHGMDEASMLQMPVVEKHLAVDTSDCRCPGYVQEQCEAEYAQGCRWSDAGESNAPWCQCLGEPIADPPTMPTTSMPPPAEKGPCEDYFGDMSAVVSATGSYTIESGQELSGLAGHAVVIHSWDMSTAPFGGERIGCGILSDDGQGGLIASNFVDYPGDVNPGGFNVQGTFTVTAGTAALSQDIAWDLTGVDPRCNDWVSGPGGPHCGLHIHPGLSCESHELVDTYNGLHRTEWQTTAHSDDGVWQVTPATNFMGSSYSTTESVLTVADPDVGHTSASSPYCEGNGMSSPCIYMHLAGSANECQSPAPPDGCHRYFTVKYSSCPELDNFNFDARIDTTSAFTTDGVFIACADRVISSEMNCYGPPADLPESCDCSTALP